MAEPEDPVDRRHLRITGNHKAVAEPHVDAVARHVSEFRLRDLVDPRIELEDGLPRVGMERLDVAREREPAATDV